MSEILFTRVYNKLIKRHNDPEALTYLLGFDSIPIRAEKSIYDIAEWCRTSPALAAYVKQTPATQLAVQLESPSPSGVESEDWLEWQNRWETHIREFGHFIYDLDFAKPLPADDPVPLLDTCKCHQRPMFKPVRTSTSGARRTRTGDTGNVRAVKGIETLSFLQAGRLGADSVRCARKGLPTWAWGIRSYGDALGDGTQAGWIRGYCAAG
jgi:pyruvate,water dikinase